LPQTLDIPAFLDQNPSHRTPIRVQFKGMKKTDVIRALKQAGWWLDRQGGSHEVWTDGNKTVTVPRHREINEFTARAIIRETKR
jgi:mRNA interferase HicA